jgi:putative flippase GtrA
VVSGLTSLGADYGAFIISLYLIRLPLKVSVFVGLGLGFIVNFSMNKFWAFRTTPRAKSHHKVVTQLLLYSILFMVNYTFTYFFIKYLQQDISIPASIGKILATGIVTVWNYIIYKLAIFREKVDVPVILE